MEALPWLLSFLVAAGPGPAEGGPLLVTSQGRGLWARGMFCPHGSPTSISPSVKGRGPGMESRGPGLSSNLLKGLGVPHSGPGFHGYQRSWKTPETFRKKEGRAQKGEGRGARVRELQ